MTQRTFRADLVTSEFPHNFRELSSTVIVNQGFELPRSAPNGSGGNEQVKSFGLPQPYFMQNVIPVSRGLSAVKFKKVLEGSTNAEILNTFLLRGPNGRSAYLMTALNSAYVYDPEGGTRSTLEVAGTVQDRIFVATVKEETYIYYGYSIYKYDFDIKQLIPCTLNGIPDPAMLKGICPAGAYLILWDTTRVYISSAVDPLDFDISQGLITGAAVTGILSIKGSITCCLPLGENFIIYTSSNCVAAQQTGNLSQSFVFTEIPGSNGISLNKHVAFNSTGDSHIAWTTGGFQEVALNGATTIFPELSDGISRGIILGYDEVFKYPLLERHRELDTKLTILYNRYLLISSKPVVEDSIFSVAYIYDLSLRRWGRLDIPHIGFIEHNIPESFVYDTYDSFAAEYPFYEDIPDTLIYGMLGQEDSVASQSTGKNLGVVKDNGDVYVASWSDVDNWSWELNVGESATPMVLLGKYKFYRTQGMIHESLKVNKLKNAQLHLYAHDYNGRLVDYATNLIPNPKQDNQYFKRLSGDSVSVGVTGDFVLTDLEITAGDAGKINQKTMSLKVQLVQNTAVYELPDTDDCCTFTGDPMKFESILFRQEYTEIEWVDDGTGNWVEVVVDRVVSTYADLTLQECGDTIHYEFIPTGNLSADSTDPMTRVILRETFPVSKFKSSWQYKEGDDTLNAYQSTVTATLSNGNPFTIPTEMRPDNAGGITFSIPQAFIFNTSCYQYNNASSGGQFTIGADGSVTLNILPEVSSWYGATSNMTTPELVDNTKGYGTYGIYRKRTT